MNKISVVYPRFKIKTKKISEIWGDQSVFGYLTIRKLGFDEDETTLAVEAFTLLESKPKNVFVLGDINLKVFREACGLEEVIIEKMNFEDVTAIIGLKRTLETPNSVFLGATALLSLDERENSYLGAASIAMQISDGFQIETVRSAEGSRETSSRYMTDIFSESDNLRVKSQSSLHNDIGIHIYNTSSLKNVRKLKPTVINSTQTNIGYTGPISPLLEFAELVDKNNEKKSINISAADQSQSILLQIKLTKKIVVIRHDNAEFIDYSKFIQRYHLSTNPGELAQGAFISTPVYHSNTKARYRLLANVCTNCESIEFPPRKLCKQCGSHTVKGPFLSRIGKLYTFTKILKGAGPTEFDHLHLIEGEYGVGVIEFPEGPKVIAQLSDINFESLEIGDEMKMVFRKIYFQEGSARYGYKFTNI